MTQPATYSDVTRVRLPGALNAQVREIAQRAGVPVSTVIRDALTWYTSHPATKASNPQTSDKVTT